MHQKQISSPVLRRWTPAEDQRLHNLRVVQHRTWSEIAKALDRTVSAVTKRWYHLKITQSSSFEEWNAAMDKHIIDGRRHGLMSGEIGAGIDVPAEAVQGRWYELQQRKKVPEDVLAIWRRKGEVEWSEEEDETILKAWIDGKDEEEIVECARTKGKYKCDVRERYKVLVREKGTIYRRLMGLDQAKPAPHALERALGKKKFAWME